jgi:hypothetical protein
VPMDYSDHSAWGCRFCIQSRRMVFSSDLVSARDCNMQRPAAKSKAASSFLNEIVLLQQHMLDENRSCTLCRRFHVLFENHVFGCLDTCGYTFCRPTVSSVRQSKIKSHLLLTPGTTLDSQHLILPPMLSAERGSQHCHS